jgi:hypothetical protein
VICATGVSFDLSLRCELDGIVDYIAMWSDRFAPAPDEVRPELGKLPYLGKSYEFLEKIPGAAPWLSRIYAFNFSAMASMGQYPTGSAAIATPSLALFEALPRPFPRANG